jgi:AraC family transcriptional activator FtrA
MPRSVALALSRHVGLYELAAPCAIFGVDRSDLAGCPWYSFRVCAPGKIPVDQWFIAHTAHTYDDLVSADTVIVPTCHDDDLRPPSDLVEAVRVAHASGARIVSICTGAFVLAEAGVLSGKHATTHWLHAATLARRYPDITVEPDVLYIDEGDVLTSAGKAAGSDLCLHIVRTDYGAATANAIARRLVTPPHRDGGQAQYIPAAATATPDWLQDTLAWAQRHIGDPLTVASLAREAGVSPRTLNRNFHQRLATSPLRWLQQQRLQCAQELLETTDHTVDRIAELAGFAGATALRREFHLTLHTTPDVYRRTWSVWPRTQ